MYQDSSVSADELFRIVMIDRKRKMRMTIQLRDKEGDEIPVRETIEKLSEFITDKIKEEEGNVCKQQIMPLMSQAVVGGMIKLMGHGFATYMLSQEHVRFGLIHMMTVSFYLVKWLQAKDIKIHTTEEPVSQTDIDMYDRISKANDMSMQAASAGVNPKEVIREMLRRGSLHQSDLTEMGLEDMTIEDIEEEKEKGYQLMDTAGIIKHLVDPKKGIREDFEDQYFEFYVAGYTKTCKGQPVQQYHASLYADAQMIVDKPEELDNYLFPFGFKKPITRVRLETEPTNKYDPNALVVIAEHPFHMEKFMQGEDDRITDMVLGYVPKHISRIVCHNLGRLDKGWIKKVRSIHGKKHCSTKVAIPWQVDALEEDLIFLDRLANVVE